MVMRTMRDNAKWVLVVLTVAFVGWLVFDWVQTGSGASGAQQNPVVAVVNGQEIRYVEWNQVRQRHLEQARGQVQGALSDQQRHRVEQQAWDQLVTETLIQQELERLGLQATDEEIRQAFRSSPPPSLRDHPAFQTDGQFDIQKYRQFFSQPSVNEQLLLRIENYYRQQIPRTKLYRLVASEVSLSDQDLWQHYRDRNSTARVSFVSVPAPSAVADSAVEVTDQEIRSYYEENRDEFSRPPVAVVDVATLQAEPSAEDSARARARLDSVRTLVTQGDKTFDQVVQEISEGGGDLQASQLGPMSRGDLVGGLRDVVFSLPVGQISEPVSTPSGLHLVRVSSRQGDQVTFSHVLSPVRLSREGENALFDRMDRLEGVALRSDLETAADSLGMEIRDDLRLEEGSEFVPGAGNLGVAVAWAFDGETRVGDLSQFFENASGHHLLELDDRLAAGVRPLEEVRGEIRQRLVQREKEEVLRQRMADAVEAIRTGEATLEQVAAEHGWEVRESDAFSRVSFVPGLGQNTPAVGAAFGLESGQVAGPLGAGGDRVGIVRLVEKQPVSRSQFEAQKGRLRRQLSQQLRQQHLQRWLQALREEADIRDLRGQLGGGRGSQGGRAPVS